MKLVSITKSDRPEKRLKAVFEDPKRTIHFGFKGGSTFIDEQDDAKRKAYIARHKVRENWNDPTSPGALSRYILWEKPTLQSAIGAYRRRFNL